MPMKNGSRFSWQKGSRIANVGDSSMVKRFLIEMLTSILEFYSVIGLFLSVGPKEAPPGVKPLKGGCRFFFNGISKWDGG